MEAARAWAARGGGNGNGGEGRDGGCGCGEGGGCDGHGTARLGTVRLGTPRHSTARHGTVWHGSARRCRHPVFSVGARKNFFTRASTYNPASAARARAAGVRAVWARADRARARAARAIQPPGCEQQVRRTTGSQPWAHGWQHFRRWHRAATSMQPSVQPTGARPDDAGQRSAGAWIPRYWSVRRRGVRRRVRVLATADAESVGSMRCGLMRCQLEYQMQNTKASRTSGD